MGPDDKNEASSLRWLYIDFNSYFASVEQQLNPELRGRPVAVIPAETDATCAIAASYEAKAFGIKTGTPIYEAKKLCPELICVLAEHEKYVGFHQRILEEVDHHIPVTEVCSIDEVACRLMENETSKERSTQIAHSIKRGLAANIGSHVRCSIGIAPNKYLAKIATDIQKPDGLTILSAQDIPDKLFKLALRDLPGVGHNIERRLLKAGIRDMQSLWALDAKHMRKIWGSVWGEKMWYLLRGLKVTDTETKRRSIGHSHVLAPELRDPAKAIYVARRLTLKSASRLRRMEYYAGSLNLSLKLENMERLEARLDCYRAQDSMTFLHMLDSLWNQLIKGIRTNRIKKISILLDNLIAANEVQPDLFGLPDIDCKKREKTEKISRALDKINYKYGRDSISLGMLPSQGKTFSGTKIAFTRIPDIEEFLE